MHALYGTMGGRPQGEGLGGWGTGLQGGPRDCNSKSKLIAHVQIIMTHCIVNLLEARE